MSKEQEYIDLTGDTPLITKIDKQVLKSKHIDLSSDSSTSLDFEWDIIRKRALRSQRNNHNNHLHLSDTDSFDSCEGFIEKGGAKPEENLGILGFKFRTNNIPKNITINNYNNTINLLSGQDQTSVCIHPIDNTITISANNNQQAANSAAKLNNNYSSSSSDSSSTSSGTDEIYKPTDRLQLPTKSYVRPIPTRARTKASQNYQGDRNSTDTKPFFTTTGKSADDAIAVDSGSDTYKPRAAPQKRKEYWSDDSIEVLAPESIKPSFFGGIPARRSRKSRKRLNKGGIKISTTSPSSAEISAKVKSDANSPVRRNEKKDERNNNEFFAEV